MKLQDLVAHLHEHLRVGEIKDYPTAMNGLQVENAGTVSKVAVAVDGCEAVLQKAVDAGADLLIVHHGMFWGGLAPVSGALYRKLKLALDNNLAIYSMHLPLDAHAELGNNALLCDALEFAEREPFLGIGWKVETEISRDELRRKLEAAVGGKVHLAPGGPEICRKIGVVTGGAGGEIYKAAAEGVDTFITGEGTQWTYTAAEEAGINLFYAGHYATETFGVCALGQYLQEKYGLPWQFLDHPTGL